MQIFTAALICMEFFKCSPQCVCVLLKILGANLLIAILSLEAVRNSRRKIQKYDTKNEIISS